MVLGASLNACMGCATSSPNRKSVNLEESQQNEMLFLGFPLHVHQKAWKCDETLDKHVPPINNEIKHIFNVASQLSSK